MKLFVLSLVLVGLCVESADAGLFRRHRTGLQRPAKARVLSRCSGGSCRLR